MTSDKKKQASVLVVEDDFVLLDVITSLFESADLRVHSACSGEAALTVLRDKGPAIDWLFTDIGLPGFVDGWTVANEYRLSYPLRPIIYASTAARRERLTVHGSVYIEKPFKPVEIMRLAEMMQSEIAAFAVGTGPRLSA